MPTPIIHVEETLGNVPLSNEMRDGLIARINQLETLREQKISESANREEESLVTTEENNVLWEEIRELDMEAIAILRQLSIDNIDDPYLYHKALSDCLLDLAIIINGLNPKDADERYDFASETREFAAEALELNRALYTVDPTEHIESLTAFLFDIGNNLGWHLALSICPDIKDIFLEAVEVARGLYLLDYIQHAPRLIDALESLGNFIYEGLNLTSWISIAHWAITNDGTFHGPNRSDPLIGFLRCGPTLYSEARDTYLEAAAIARTLYKLDPVMYGPMLVYSLQSCGMFLRKSPELSTQKWSACLVSYEGALELYARDPVTHAVNLARSLQSIGSLLCDGPERRNEAFHSFAEAVGVAQELYIMDIRHGSVLIGALRLLGDLFHNTFKLYPEARNVYSRAMVVARDLCLADLIVHGPQLAESLVSYGSSLSHDWNFEYEAERAHWDAIEVARTLHRKDPVAGGIHLINCLNSLAKSLGHTQEVLDLYTESVDIARQLHDTSPVVYRRELVDALKTLAHCLHHGFKRYSEARDTYSEAVVLARELYRTSPINHGVLLAESLLPLCNSWSVSNHPSEARRAADEALEILTSRNSHKTNPQHELINMLLRLHQFYERLNHHGGLLRVDYEAAALLDRSITILRSDRKIGGGSFGEVYLAETKRLDFYYYGKFDVRNKRLVVKMITTALPYKRNLSQFLKISSLNRELRRELVVSFRLGTVQHQNIVPYFGYIVEKGQIGLVFEYFAGGNVLEYLNSKRLLNLDRGNLCRDLAHGLHHLHGLSSPIVHGDLKPSNVVIHEDGYAALCDFGLSRLLMLTNEFDYAKGTNTRVLRSLELTASRFDGTLRYCAPELLKNDDARCTRKSDIWAFACTCVEIMTGLQPFAQYTGPMAEAQIVDALFDEGPNLPYNIEPIIFEHPEFAFIAACWSTEPSERPTMEEICEQMGWLEEEKASDL